MFNSNKNLIPVDKEIKSMCDKIEKKGESPLKPHKTNYYTSSQLGELGEQYVKCFFCNRKITKLKETDEVSPDFKILIDGKEFKLEVKTVSNLYKNPLLLIDEIYREEKNKRIKKLINYIRKNSTICITPFEIHKEDELKIKEDIKKLFNRIKIDDKKIKEKICSKNREYIISIYKGNKKVKGLDWVISGFPPDETKTLNNIISKKVEQIGNSDILCIVLLNGSITKSDLIQFFYEPIKLSYLKIENSDSVNIPIDYTIQYKNKKTVWDYEFKNKENKIHKIEENLKCIIVIYPSSEQTLIFPSIHFFENFSSIAYHYLVSLFEENGFDVYCAIHQVYLEKILDIKDRNF